MPQLIPFFFLTQIFWGYLIIYIFILINSKYILPRILNLYLSRLFIIRL